MTRKRVGREIAIKILRKAFERREFTVRGAAAAMNCSDQVAWERLRSMGDWVERRERPGCGRKGFYRLKR